MAPRPSWKGYLKLSLVTCAVELTNATTYAEKVSFKTINRATGNTVKRQYLDSVTGKPVDPKNEVKGYKVGGDEYLLVEDDEIDAVRIESSHTMALDSFVKRDEIEQIYLDSPYYLAPADKVSEEAFAVIRDALEKKKMAGLARIVLARRERPVLIEPMGKGMLLTTLRYEANVVNADSVFAGIGKVEVDEEMTDLAAHIIEKKTGHFDPSKFEDHYETALLNLIKSKQDGETVTASKPSVQKDNVVNLFDALKKSLAEEEGDAKPAKASKAKAKAEAPKRKSA
ncbi:Ku protein [Escherichia coli]|nr:Ku protein [Escherichia coli]